MYKIVLISLFVVLFSTIKSQNINYSSIQKEIKSTFPEIDFSNKLLVVSIWNSSDITSREMNKEINRTYELYKGAKFKDGLKGIVYISISSDTNEMQYSICMKKDSNTYQYVICDFKSFLQNSKLFNMELSPFIKNLTFNTNGILIYQNLPSDQIFKSFNALLTR
jgi:hypothetical protein